ncbi:hypothetical protein HK413_05845 [Mucilaginibacter sp. S1162]|uniref:Uncharacterized protein n=2 Tax=Mucilaginibacter humi TaxID=2732510 RepID=A0ABX1W2E4_9SPHI|nr:hypothetical protein [Mucilaginibacter humi]
MIIACQVSGQQILVTDAKKKALNNISSVADTSYQKSHQRAFSQAFSRGWITNRRTRNGGVVALQGLNNLGFPKYLTTHGNTPSQATTGTNQVQPGGTTGLSLTGSSTFLNNKLAMWDGGWVYKAHQNLPAKPYRLRILQQLQTTLPTLRVY